MFDDQWFGLGDADLDLRDVSLDLAQLALRLGFVGIDRAAGTIAIDAGRDASGATPDLVIGLGDALDDLRLGDVFLA